MSSALKLKAELSARPTDELVRELIGLLGYAAEKLQRMAFIVQELESRGHSTAAIRDQFLMRQLRRIAAGDLLPEVVQHFLGNPTVIDALARLPVAEQRRLLDAGKVDVLVNGRMEAIDLVRLTKEAIHIAFGPDFVRSEAEQRLAITAPAAPTVSPRSREPEPVEPAEPQWRVRAVPERQGIKVGNSFGSKEEVIAALSQLAGPVKELDIEAGDTDTVTVRVTVEEKQALRVACKRRGLPEWHLVREALRTCGLI